MVCVCVFSSEWLLQHFDRENLLKSQRETLKNEKLKDQTEFLKETEKWKTKFHESVLQNETQQKFFQKTQQKNLHLEMQLNSLQKRLSVCWASSLFMKGG